MSKTDKAKKRAARKTAGKPSAPREIEAAQAANDTEATEARNQTELVASRAEARRLKAQPGVRVSVDGVGKLTGARRLDLFALLLERSTISQEQHDAVRWLEATMHVAMGWDSPERRPDHIRATTEGAPGQSVSQTMIDASREVARIRDLFDPREWSVLEALLQPQAAILTRWRDVVERQTGEKTDHGQAAALRRICERLMWAKSVPLR